MITITVPGRVRLFALSLAGLLSMAVAPTSPPPALPEPLRPGAAGDGPRYYVVGNPEDVVTATRPGLVLQGGGATVDRAFEWMIERSGGGDFVVIRAGGRDGYNAEIARLVAPGGVRADSVATLVIPSRAAALEPFVAETIRKAEALWIAGGDQACYIRYWKGTPVEDAIQAVIARGAPVGGTSAGMAILGQFLYSAEKDPSPEDILTSAQSLLDPFNDRLTLVHDFLDVPILGGVILDTHFVERDRMGRMAAFLARINRERWSEETRGIGIERETALLVEPDGRTTLVARPGYPRPAAYFLRMAGPPDVCAPGVPLTARDIQVLRLAPLGTFDLRTWTASQGASYTLSVANNKLLSSLPGGDVYH